MTFYLLSALAIFWLTALFYVAVMHFKLIKDSPRWADLHWSTKLLGYSMLYPGLVLDMLLNVFVMTVVFIELPQELLTTSRVRRHKFNSGGWRYRVSVFFCRNYLTPFDRNHCE